MTCQLKLIFITRYAALLNDETLKKMKLVMLQLHRMVKGNAN